MSQIYKAVTSGTLPPSVPTQFTANSGTAVPAANNLNLFGDDSSVYNANGISTVASGSTVTTLLNNRIQGTGTTVGATTADVITFNLGSTPAGYIFDVNIASFNASTPAAAGYYVQVSVRTTGVAATVIDTLVDPQEELVLEDCQVTGVASGNNLIIRVTGVAGLSINWSASGNYERAI